MTNMLFIIRYVHHVCHLSHGRLQEIISEFALNCRHSIYSLLFSLTADVDSWKCPPSHQLAALFVCESLLRT